MVELVRVDGRLIHGMVTVGWCSEIRPHILAVVNDEAANDPFHTMTLKLAKPAGIDCFVWTKEKAIDRINGPKYANKKIFMTVATVEDAVYMANNCPSIKTINIGPEVDGTKGRTIENKIEISHGVYINEEKYLLLKEIQNKGVEVYARVTPSMPKVEWNEIEKKFEK